MDCLKTSPYTTGGKITPSNGVLGVFKSIMPLKAPCPNDAHWARKPAGMIILPSLDKACADSSLRETKVHNCIFNTVFPLFEKSMLCVHLIVWCSWLYEKSTPLFISKSLHSPIPSQVGINCVRSKPAILYWILINKW